MAESLLAILFVTSSAKGSNIVFHWPPYPSCQPRLARPKPQRDAKSLFFDNVWVAATNYDLKSSSSSGEQQASSVYDDPELDEWDYEWKRPNTYREGARSLSFGESSTRSRPGSRRTSLFKKDPKSPDKESSRRTDTSPSELDYESLLGYPAEFLANILCPKDNMCHQKFELVVDDLAFIGHPVCAEQDGGWRFKRPRGRGTRSSTNNPSPSEHPSPEHEASPRDEPATPALTAASPPHTFHLVFVIDLPDPSSSASGNVFKYFHVIYEQLAFTVTAVLFQEQVLHHFVDTECESLGALRDSAISKCASFDEFIGRALDASSLARAMKTLYEAVKSNSIARLVLNEVGVEIQLPPQLDRLLHAEEENPDFVEHPDPDAVSWGPELSFGWGLPTLAPWKSLLLYDMDEDQNGLKTNLSRPGLSPDDQLLVEGLVHFLDTVSIFDSLAVIAHSLDWNLERQVYPTVRWLVYHRRAKIVDTIHRGLRSVFALSSKVDRLLTELSEEFAKAFPHPAIPPLPKLFALISNPSSTASSSSAPLSPSSHTRFSSHAIDSTTQIPSSSSSPDFFTCVVRSKDLIPVYQDVVVWLLRRELIVALHLHVCIVATPEIKERIRKRRARAAKRRFEAERGRESRRGGTGMDSQFIHDGFTTETFVARSSRTRRLSSRSATDSSTVVEGGITQSFKQHDAFTNRGRSRLRRVDTEGADNGEYRSHSRLRYSVTEDDDVDDTEGALEEGDDEDGAEEDDDVGNEWENDRADDNHLPSIIPEPGQATPLQRKWIEAMSEGKPDEVARRFRLINQFFDGKRTDDEILYSADITRKQLREVLQQYDEFLLTALHPA